MEFLNLAKPYPNGKKRGELLLISEQNPKRSISIEAQSGTEAEKIVNKIPCQFFTFPFNGIMIDYQIMNSLKPILWQKLLE